MPIDFKNGNYPYTTIVQDAHGCIHLFKGQCVPTNHPTLPMVGGQEADIFIQSCTAIECIQQYLTDKQIEELNKGYTIQVRGVPPDYFE